MLIFLRVVLTPLCLLAIGASATFAWAFGWSKGATPEMQWAFAALLCGLDIAKPILPILASWAASVGDRGKSRVTWACFWILTAASMWAAAGVDSIQKNERRSAKAEIESKVANAEAKLRRIKEERDRLPEFKITTTASIDAAESGIAAARNAVEAADRAVTQECGRVGDNCRARQRDATDRRAELARAIEAKNVVLRDKAATEAAAELGRRLAEAEAELAGIDRKTGAKDADPQSAAIAKATGLSEEAVAGISFLIAAVLVEIGSGLLPWMLFGHGARREPERAPEPAPVAALPAVVEPVAPVVRPVFAEVETPADFRDRFYAACTFPKSGDRVTATAMYSGYQKFCDEQGVKPMSLAEFGRHRPKGIEKRKINGVNYYLDVALAPGYSVAPPVLRVVASNG